MKTIQAISDAFAEKPINILIVDDEPANLLVLETILDEPDYRLVRATSADQALMALMAELNRSRVPDTGLERCKFGMGRKRRERLHVGSRRTLETVSPGGDGPIEPIGVRPPRFCRPPRRQGRAAPLGDGAR